MGKQFLLLSALALALTACGNGNNNTNNPYGYGVAGGGTVTNPPGNYLGGVCGVAVVRDYNSMASLCNNGGGAGYYGNNPYGGCEQMAYGFLNRYRGISCTIQTDQGQMMMVNEPMIRSILANRGGQGFGLGQQPPLAPAPAPGPAPGGWGGQPGYPPGYDHPTPPPAPYPGQPTPVMPR